jgi:hypothetical protein
MANFAVTNSTVSGFGSSQAGLSAAFKTICAAAASSQSGSGYIGLRRGKVYDILVGTNTAPADNYIEWVAKRATVGTSGSGWAGSLSSGSSQIALDPADGLTNSLLACNSSNEGQVTLLTIPDLWYVGINQRASYRWVAAPGSELVWPAVSSASGAINGIVLQARSGAYTSTVTGTILVSEQ